MHPAITPSPALGWPDRLLHLQPRGGRRRRAQLLADRRALGLHGPPRRRHDRPRPDLRRGRGTWTGSLHIVDLPDPAAAHTFVAEEPYNRASLFADHFIHRFDNTIGRTMWDFPREPELPRFLVISHDRIVDPSAVPPGQLIFHGELFQPDKSKPAGAAFAIQAPSHASVTALLADEHPGLEIHAWEFGGHR